MRRSRRRIPIAVAAAMFGVATAAAGAPALIPGGAYAPFIRVKPLGAGQGATPAPVTIQSFRLDAEPVTNGEYLAFVTDHPEWRRSKAAAIFAEPGYLKRWRDDLSPGDGADPNAPVTDVSWFAARAYCKAQGMRLPTTAEWEYALARTDADRANARAISLEWLARPNAPQPAAVGKGAPNGYGVSDMVGLVWEWTSDFDAFATTAESRDPNGGSNAAFCGGAAAGVTDTTDYPAFMRYSMRGSLTASDAVDSLGFRCAGPP